MPRIEVKIGTMKSPLNSPSDSIFKGKDEKCIDFNFQLPSYRPIAFNGIVYTLIIINISIIFDEVATDFQSY